LTLYHPIVQQVNFYGLDFDILRLDLIHPLYGGNKWFKLYYNVKKARSENRDCILTFGGANSNHICATAAYSKQLGLKSVGIIRGEAKNTQTLLNASDNGMELHFITRNEYLKKEEEHFLKLLSSQFGNFYLVPEGGNNTEGIIGCAEILMGLEYNQVFCACGTGATFTGLMLGKHERTDIIGISVLKGNNLLPRLVSEMICKAAPGKNITISGNEVLIDGTINKNCIINTYAFGGYAKCNEELNEFKFKFEARNHIPLDYIYTSKLFYAVDDLSKKGKINSKAKKLIIHSGGLQGNNDFERRYQLNPTL
jgi:1-aminocyclopropane-1-carboxylate deaminase